MIQFEQPNAFKKIGNIDSISIDVLRRHLAFDIKPNDSIIYYYNKSDSSAFIIGIFSNHDSTNEKKSLNIYRKIDSLVKKNSLNFHSLNMGIKIINNHRYIIDENTNNADLHKYGYNRTIWNYSMSVHYFPNKRQIIAFYFVSCSKKYPVFRTEAYHVLETLNIK